MPSAAGRLLVATPPLVDPHFDRTVVYVLEHSDEGAIGVILNRPGEEALGVPLERWNESLSTPALVFDGGPVETEMMVALGLDDTGPGAGRITTVDLTEDPLMIEDPPSRLRVFRGYSGWGPGQLDDEVESGAWIVLDEADDVFDPEPIGLWRRVLRRQPGRLSWLAEVPDDLESN